MRTKCLGGKEGRWSAQAELKKTGRQWDTRGGFWLRRRGGHDNKAIRFAWIINWRLIPGETGGFVIRTATEGR